MAERKCRAPEFGIACNKTLGLTNNSGFCSQHYYYSKKDPKNYQATPQRGPKLKADAPGDAPQQTNGHAQIKINLQPVVIAQGEGIPVATIAPNGAYRVACQVSEWAMDRIWLRLTPEEKAQLLFPAEPAAERTEPQHA